MPSRSAIWMPFKPYGPRLKARRGPEATGDPGSTAEAEPTDEAARLRGENARRQVALRERDATIERRGVVHWQDGA
jgi:hypothetical protein